MLSAIPVESLSSISTNSFGALILLNTVSSACDAGMKINRIAQIIDNDVLDLIPMPLAPVCIYKKKGLGIIELSEARRFL